MRPPLSDLLRDVEQWADHAVGGLGHHGHHYGHQAMEDTSVAIWMLQPNARYKNWTAIIAKVILAPTGCLQYFISETGQIKSFNYKPETEGDTPNHLANLNYGVCFRVANGYCGIRYSQLQTDPYSFTISEDAFSQSN